MKRPDDFRRIVMQSLPGLPVVILTAFTVGWWNLSMEHFDQPITTADLTLFVINALVLSITCWLFSAAVYYRFFD